MNLLFFNLSLIVFLTVNILANNDNITADNESSDIQNMFEKSIQENPTFLKKITHHLHMSQTKMGDPVSTLAVSDYFYQKGAYVEAWAYAVLYNIILDQDIACCSNISLKSDLFKLHVNDKEKFETIVHNTTEEQRLSVISNMINFAAMLGKHPRDENNTFPRLSPDTALSYACRFAGKEFVDSICDRHEWPGIRKNILRRYEKMLKDGKNSVEIATSDANITNIKKLCTEIISNTPLEIFISDEKFHGFKATCSDASSNMLKQDPELFEETWIYVNRLGTAVGSPASAFELFKYYFKQENYLKAWSYLFMYNLIIDQEVACCSNSLLKNDLFRAHINAKEQFEKIIHNTTEDERISGINKMLTYMKLATQESFARVPATNLGIEEEMVFNLRICSESALSSACKLIGKKFTDTVVCELEECKNRRLAIVALYEKELSEGKTSIDIITGNFIL